MHLKKAAIEHTETLHEVYSLHTVQFVNWCLQAKKSETVTVTVKSQEQNENSQ
jgi:hypothetical protein